MSSLANITILVVDDEELIREVASMVIEEEGGSVIIAKDGKEATTVFQSNKDKIDCVVMDFSMPEANGYEAYLEMVKVNPDVKVVMISGLKIVAEVDKLRRDGKIFFLSKPFQPNDLVNAIRTWLDKK